MLERIRNTSPATVEYWFTIGFAVVWILLSRDMSGNDLIYRLFGSGYMIIHAHGRRILAAIRETRPPASAGQS